MKIRKTNKPLSFIKFYLLKYQFYKKVNINKLIIDFKQSLKVIYSYHVQNKKILFIGFSFNKNISNQFSHLFISKNKYTKKVLSNCFLKEGENRSFPNLIVFNNYQLVDEKIIKETLKYNIPIVVFGDYSKQINFYNVQGNFNQKNFKKFVDFLIFSIIKKSST